MAKGRAREIISDRRPGPGVSGRRKSTLNVRGALLYKKNLQQVIEESVNNPFEESYDLLKLH